MRKIIAILPVFLLVGILGGVGITFAEDYKYISAKDLNTRLINGSPMFLIDLRKAEQYAKGHIKGAIETDAVPVETDEQKTRVAELLPLFNSSTEDIILLCPKGDKNAKKAYTIYKANGVDMRRILILANGMNQWTYETETKSQ